MVALLVLATFAAFILVDVLLHPEKYRFRVAEESPSEPSSGPAPIVAGVALPESLHYHPGHTWAVDRGQGRIRIGVDEYAASLLGRIEKIEAPPRGRWLRQGEKGWIVHTPMGQAPMLAPAEGEIVAVNDQALRDPAVVRRDPYGRGWLFEIFTPDTEVSLRNLFSGTLARRWMEWSVAELRMALSPSALATALDGGRIHPELGEQLSPEKWRELTKKFFRN